MQANQANTGAIAIIGLGGRFPGANSIAEFWDNLVAGRDALRRYTQDEVQQGIAAHDIASIPYVRKQVAGGSWVAAGYHLEDADKFDAGFFGYTPAEAELLDPQQRLFLECAWAALEDAGYIPDDCPGTVGVYAGTALSRYFFNNIFPNREIMFASSKDLIAGIGNEPDYITNRTAYKLNLTGPSITVQTACSTSLVAIHLACRALRAGECDSALAGGALVTVPGGLGYQYQEGSMASPDGLLRAFDAKAEGTVFSEGGVGIVVLKRLEDAQADHDRIYAVIRGSAVTNDGSFKAGYTAPGIDGQIHVIDRALADAAVNPEHIGYVEAHGTSTPLGDPIEITALSRAWRKHTERTGYCALGSLKTNVGHLAPVAGVAAVIKTALALWHKTLPPSLNFDSPNPRIDFANSPFVVNQNLRSWDCAGKRYAAVSSFGIGGTNAHAILEQAPAQTATQSGDKLRTFVLSAKSSKALSRAAENLDRFLRRQPDLDLDDVAFTLQEGRKAFDVRAAIAADSREALQLSLAGIRDNPSKTKALPADGKKVFLFTGQGSQYLGMGRGLYENLPIFREVFDDCCEKLRVPLKLDLRELILAGDDADPALAEQLGQTRLAQPMLFAFEYALAKQMQAIGIEPDAMIGHSLGEYVAACLASVFELDDALRLVALRGALMQAMPAGAMLSVSLDEAAASAYVGGEVSLAAVNSPAACVLSGPHAAIAAVRERLEAADVACRPLLTSHAFHSAMMQPMIADFTAAVRLAAPKAPNRPYVSNLTGDWMSAADARNPDYWAKHLLGCVRFRQGMETLLAGGGTYFIEIGPGNVLSTFARHAINAGKSPAAVVQTVRHPKDAKPDTLVFRQALGDLWAAGLDLDWERVDADNQGRRISLPTYPFARERHWLEPPKVSDSGADNAAQRVADLSQWFYAPSWKRQPTLLPAIGDWSGERVLILAERGGLAQGLSARFEALGGEAIIVSPGETFRADADGGYTLRLGETEDFEKLAAVLQDAQPTAIVHALCATPRSEASLASENHWLERSFHSLVWLAQHFSAEAGERRLPLLTLSTEIHDVLPGEPVNPLKAALLGVHLCLGHEYRKLNSRNLDFRPEDVTGDDGLEAAVERAVGELSRLRAETRPLLTPADHFAAYRHGYRWIAHYEPTRIEASPLDFAADGAYLITGGLGGLGLAVAEHLAVHGARHIVLLGRSALPPKAEWTRYLTEHEIDDRNAERIRKLLAIEARGVEVELCRGDVVDAGGMTEMVAALLQKYGRIAGVVHSAGVAGGGLIQLKTREAADRVLLPKVRGMLTLEQAFRAANAEPGFIVLFSSLFAVIGGIGQVDYSAANNVLDAFARARPSGGQVLSLNFGGWREIGMAVDAGLYARQAAPAIPEGKTLAHPYLHSRRGKSAQNASYVAWLREPDHWALMEHRIQGVATMPGTGLVEMVRAAFQDFQGAGQIVIDNLYFFRPLRIPAGDLVEVCCDFAALPAGGYSFEVYSREAGAKSPLLAGDIAGADLPPVAIDLSALSASCAQEIVDFSDGRPQAIQDDSGFLSLGPRWQVIREIGFDTDQLLGTVVLPEAFVDDLRQYMLHPSLLDMASGPIVGHLLRRLNLNIDGEYLPFGYGRLTVAAPLPANFHTHVRFRGLHNDQDALSFDITLYDTTGHRLARIEEFMLKKVPDGAFAPTADSSYGDDDSLSTAEGLEVFQRALASGGSPQWAISPQPLDGLIARMKAERIAEETREQGGKPKVQREDADVAPPTNRTEEILVGIVEGVLGIEPVGIYDNFFDIGLDSVMGIQVVSQAKRFGLTVKPNQLFEHQTVAALAAAIGETVEEPASQALLTFGQREALAADAWDSLRVAWPEAAATADLPAVLENLAEDYPLINACIEQIDGAPRWTQTETVPLMPLTEAEHGNACFRILIDADSVILQARPALGLDADGLSQIASALLARLSGNAGAARVTPWRPATHADLAAMADERDFNADAAVYEAMLADAVPMQVDGICTAVADIRVSSASLKGLDRLRDALNLDAKDLLLAALASSCAECLDLAPLHVRYTETRILSDSGAVLRYGFPVRLEHGGDPLEAVKRAKAALKQAPGDGFGFECLADGPNAARLPAIGFAWLGNCGIDGFEPSSTLARHEALAISACLSPSGLLLRLAADAERAARLPELAAILERTLTAYLEAAEQARGRGFTTADFGDAALSEEDFDTLFQSIE